MIRILQYIGTLQSGGSQAMIMNLYRAINKELIQFDFVVHNVNNETFTEEVEKLGGKIFVAPRYKGKNHFKYISWWNSFFKEHTEYKVVHSHIRSTAAIVLRIAKKYRCITIAHSHSTSSGNGIGSIVKNIYQFPIRYISDYFMGCSQIAGEWLYGKKICSSDKYINMRNAIEVNKYTFSSEIAKEVRDELNLGDNTVIGHVGRFSEPKNHMFLLKVFAEIHKRDKKSRLLLVGDGELRSQIEKKITELNLNDSVILTGSRSDVNRLLMAIDIFIFPSIWEGLPVSVVEAQASGLQCAVSTSVTQEVCLSELVTRISLSSGAEFWCDKVFEMNEKLKMYGRPNVQDAICKAGYDANASAEWLSDFYYKCFKEAV